jgi:hypothetical protein
MGQESEDPDDGFMPGNSDDGILPVISCRDCIVKTVIEGIRIKIDFGTASKLHKS